MPEFQTIFRLGRRPGEGVFCGADGLSIGEVALLERAPDVSDGQPWRPRPVAELNRDLSRCYGLPIEVEPKAGGLEVIAQALARGDLVHAQMAALHLRFPDPPDLEKAAGDVQAAVDLARRLEASGLLKREWDPNLHPRWLQGSPDSVGGRFAPKDSQGGGASGSQSARPTADGATRSGPQQIAAEIGVSGLDTSGPNMTTTSGAGPDEATGTIGAGIATAASGSQSSEVTTANLTSISTESTSINLNAVDFAIQNIGDGALSSYGLFGANSEASGFRGESLHGVLDPKCNFFVFDSYATANAAPLLSNKKIPVANDWFDVNVPIFASNGGHFSVVLRGRLTRKNLNLLRPGDIISSGHHVGIYVPIVYTNGEGSIPGYANREIVNLGNNSGLTSGRRLIKPQTISAATLTERNEFSPSPTQPFLGGVTWGDWGFRGDSDDSYVVVRRYVPPQRGESS